MMLQSAYSARLRPNLTPQVGPFGGMPRSMPTA
jgi:hypothetical protein